MLKKNFVKNDLLDKKTRNKINKIRDYIEKTAVAELEENCNEKSDAILDNISDLHRNLGNSDEKIKLYNELIDLSKKRITQIYGNKINKEIVLLSTNLCVIDQNIKNAYERYFNGECIVKPKKKRQNFSIVYSLIPIGELLFFKAYNCIELKKYDEAIDSLLEAIEYDPLNYRNIIELLYAYEKKGLTLTKNDKIIDAYNLLYEASWNKEELIDCYCKTGQYYCYIKEYRKALACFTIVYKITNEKPHKEEKKILIAQYGKNWFKQLDANQYEIAKKELSRDLYNFYNKDKVDNKKDEIMNEKITLTDAQYDICYDMQYNILPNNYFLCGKCKKALKFFNNSSEKFYKFMDNLYDLTSLMTFNTIKNPFEEKDIFIKNETIFNESCFNILTIQFLTGLPPVLAESIYVLYDKEFKVVRYITLESTYGSDNSYCFCETSIANKRVNCGYIPKDDNIIKAKLVEIWNIKPLNRDDFKIYGLDTEDAVGGIKDRCLLKSEKFIWVFSGKDDISTYRGVKLNDSIQKVFDMYGVAELKLFNKSKDLIYNTLCNELNMQGDGDFSSFNGNELFCDYTYNNVNGTENENSLAIIRFYFGIDSKVKLIGFMGTSLKNQ